MYKQEELMEIQTKIKRVGKEDVFLLHFPKEDVLFGREEREERAESLTYVFNQTRNTNEKVAITFQDIEGVKTVETEIASINAEEINLSKVISIPTNRIHKIETIL